MKTGYLERESDVAATTDMLDRLDRESERFKKTNPKVYQVMQFAKEAGVRPAFIVNGLRGGDDAFAYLESTRQSFIVAAYVVSTTELNKQDSVPEDLIRKLFCEKIQNIQTRQGVVPTLVKQTFDVIRTIYPEYSADLPA